MKKVFISIIFFWAGFTKLPAQCAMCRATLENNISNGNVGIAAGINFGILYLFLAPYVVVGTLAVLWYYTSKKGENKFNKSNFLG